jgi:hypothetical protein
MVDVDDAAVRGKTRVVPHMPAVRGEKLSELEIAVVAAARHDPLSSLTPRGRWRHRFDLLAGLRDASPPLADPALEAFRRAAVHAWHGHAVLPEGERSALANAGYPGALYDILQAAVRGSLARSAANR